MRARNPSQPCVCRLTKNVRPDGLRARFPGRPGEPLGGRVERLLPGDALELSSALEPPAPHRVEQTVRRPGVVDVGVHLGAQDTAGEGMLGIAPQSHRAPVLDGDDLAAGVRAVQRARPEDPTLRSAVHGGHPPWRHRREFRGARSIPSERMPSRGDGQAPSGWAAAHCRKISAVASSAGKKHSMLITWRARRGPERAVEGARGRRRAG